MSQLETTLTETTTRFHLGTPRQSAPVSPELREHVRTVDYRAPLASLLLGLRFRAELTSTEQALLDEIAGPDGISFLVIGRRYLHPNGVELFPVEEIRAASQAPIGTVFTQIKKARSRHQNDYLMLSVTISDQSLGRLLFGILVPAGLRRDLRAKDRFHEIARQFCLAEESVARVAQSLNGSADSHQPWILVNRASGRTVAVNSAAAGLLKSSQSELTDQEFGALRNRLGTMMGRGLTMTSLGDDTLPLCLISISAAPTPANDSAAELFLLEQMRNQLSCLQRSAVHLSATSCWKQDTEEAELASLIESNVEEMAHHLYRVELLTNFDRLERREISISRALESHCEMIRKHHPSVHRIDTRFDASADVISVPHGAIEQLVELAIQSHTRDFVDPATTTIETADSGSGLTLSISSRISHARRSDTAPNGWRSVTTHLATRLGARADHTFDPDTNMNMTVLTFDHKSGK